jgi:3-hydroxyacyl-[acyl-carrier-protein] dehydratase
MAATEHTWRVPTGHPAFAGHFPGRPIVPGVVLLDQALLLAQAQLGRHGGAWQVAQAKFLSPCGPGDELVFELNEGARGGLGFVVRCAGRDVASGQLAPVDS